MRNFTRKKNFGKFLNYKICVCLCFLVQVKLFSYKKLNAPHFFCPILSLIRQWQKMNGNYIESAFAMFYIYISTLLFSSFNSLHQQQRNDSRVPLSICFLLGTKYAYRLHLVYMYWRSSWLIVFYSCTYAIDIRVRVQTQSYPRY